MMLDHQVDKEFEKWWEADTQEIALLRPEERARRAWWMGFNLGLWDRPPGSFEVSAVEFHQNGRIKRVEFADGGEILTGNQILCLSWFDLEEEGGT
jgi:hypothetical protein